MVRILENGTNTFRLSRGVAWLAGSAIPLTAQNYFTLSWKNKYKNGFLTL